MSKKGIQKWDSETQSYIEEKNMTKKELEKRLKDFEKILIEMRKEISALGFAVAQHQANFEVLKKLTEQEKIEVVKN